MATVTLSHEKKTIWGCNSSLMRRISLHAVQEYPDASHFVQLMTDAGIYLYVDLTEEEWDDEAKLMFSRSIVSLHAEMAADDPAEYPDKHLEGYLALLQELIGLLKEYAYL